MRAKAGWIIALVLATLCACSSEQAYRSGQGWQSNQCSRLPDKAEFDRCMAQAGMPYETYKKDAASGAR